MATPVIQVNGLKKNYLLDGVSVPALRGIELQVDPGEFIAIMGASGSGKSTLMNILGCLDLPDAGSYLLRGRDVGKLDSEQLAKVRNREVGFVFQNFNLLSRTSALANVETPLIYAGVDRTERRRLAAEALRRIGLGTHLAHRPNQLSGGQQQRVAIARALIAEPALLLADEPTGNLDSDSSRDIMGVFDALHREGATIVMITHEHDVAAHAQRTLVMQDGHLQESRQ